jgi:hypothetical protein
MRITIVCGLQSRADYNRVRITIACGLQSRADYNRGLELAFGKMIELLYVP